MISEKYGRLTLLNLLDSRTKDGHRIALWDCECGARAEIAYSRVRAGSTQSCGCLKREVRSRLTHGMRYTATYSSWMAAKDRTTNPDSKDYLRYGGAGIGFSDHWKVFENFLADMGERLPGTTLDRIDGSKGYEPGNCRWATPKQQARNRKDLTVVRTPLGEMPLVDYAAEIGITKGAAHLRLKRGKLEGCSYV